MSIHVINLSPWVFDCAICDRHVEQTSGRSYGIARYEDEVVPDAYEGECGGAPVCNRCYWIERGMHAADPKSFISFRLIRKGSKDA